MIPHENRTLENAVDLLQRRYQRSGDFGKVFCRDFSEENNEWYRRAANFDVYEFESVREAVDAFLKEQQEEDVLNGFWDWVEKMTG